MQKLLTRLPFYEKKWFQFLLFTINRFENDRCRDKAASLTYTTLFAVVPMLTVFLVIISSIKALEPARQQVQHLIYTNLLPKSSIAFDQALNSFTDKSSNLTVIGILFLFLTSVMMLTSVEEAFNRIWRVKQQRGGIIGFMRYWTIISLGPILLGSAFVISSTVASLNILSNNFVGYQIDGTIFLGFISYILIILGFFIIYWTIPNRSVPIKAAAIAGILSGSIFQLLKSFFGFMMANFTSYELVYGAFAAVPIFLLWIYLSWNIVLLGVEFSFALTSFSTGNRQKRHPVIMLLDILEMFYKKQVAMEAKPFAIGVRIEHDQHLIDLSQYGMEPAELGLGAAEYSVVYHDKETGRTAYSFCMCPGGQVVASASERDHVVTNGMSLYARDSGVANSAMVVTVGPDDFGDHPLAGMAFQREWEAKAYELGGRTYKAPIQTVGDFLAGKAGSLPDKACYTYQPGVVPADLHDCLPPYVTAVMERALPYFGRRIRGFDDPAVCMTGVETRTSSPLRILRTDDRVSPTIEGLYPMGEGAGYAGGIMSAALDGAETAIRIISEYKPITMTEGAY